ncbi:SGNH/GDSL hydrolase family protein [Mucilaginibacter rubeus]|uniref:SGNH/GDSL hydrolase family protein n=1 Tax=Mucilaginibacter rubeus TaxID=2027860 RepID=A0AAE6JKQ8_9SPHI|nr:MULTISPECIES: SGNH/GDSL hydrolase family protein [Mucilaginibacter]QEM07481.1 SGNH/GDSL hydrolase family protein [Mucilaginibacter rubeus]QEM19934.1 SGNH/GDSL hydrolase family protein [Mucilaginibacter gossypii]QTE43358.1 SGNH/GDSL hydrolase family protein [Mucilaginibacter rubeus]QTE49958.1 SGNH/GDSL hydrolase family protein [Mucilaginibacter rubeus]QTE55049.1 SGNH/GDSL hydrolase family protein [Mucilaginibacter rubeus]
MKGIIFSLLTAITLSACAGKNTPAPVSYNNPPSKPVTVIKDTLTYLALGDSYTIGQSVPPEQAFPNQLANQLQGIKVNTPTIIARTGWTTDQLIEAIDQSSIKSNTYDVVTLLIGVNDQYDGLSQENYRIKFEQVLNTAIKFAGGISEHVFVLSIPDYGVTPFAQGQDAVIAPEIDQFNDINREISENAKVNYVEITGISKLAANDLTLLATDGLHPSGKMYGMWVDKLRTAVVAIFAKK